MEHPVVEASRGEYRISTDRKRIDAAAVREYLARSYWAQGISREVVERSIEGSLCFGLFFQERQVGFARIVTDAMTFAYLCDVYVLEEHRGRGLSKWLMETVLAHAALQRIRRFVLATRDAHSLYERYGFRRLAQPESYMEIFRPDIYREGTVGRVEPRSEELPSPA